MGLSWQTAGAVDFGFIIASTAMKLQHQQTFRNLNLPATRTTATNCNCNKDKPQRIIIYCQEYGNDWWGQWGPSSAKQGGSGLGGSEEAVIYLARELAHQGYRVDIYANPPAEDMGEEMIDDDDDDEMMNKTSIVTEFNHHSINRMNNSNNRNTNNSSTNHNRNTNNNNTNEADGSLKSQPPLRQQQQRGSVTWHHYSHFDIESCSSCHYTHDDDDNDDDDRVMVVVGNTPSTNHTNHNDTTNTDTTANTDTACTCCCGADEDNDIFIAWRYSVSLPLGSHCHKRFLWLHDLITAATFPHSIAAEIDGVLVQSQFHVQELLRLATGVSGASANGFEVSRFIIIPNGVATTITASAGASATAASAITASTSATSRNDNSDVDSSSDNDNSNGHSKIESSNNNDNDNNNGHSHIQISHNNSSNINCHNISSSSSSCNNTPAAALNRNHVFVYASAPNRGLEDVLQIWGDIRSHLPLAQLHVYYGFSKTVDDQLQRIYGSASAYSLFKHRILDLLRQPGVVYFGPVDHMTLKQRFRQSGFLLYPTSYPETGCITYLKAMSYGVIPISSRYNNSVLYSLSLSSSSSSSSSFAAKSSSVAKSTITGDDNNNKKNRNNNNNMNDNMSNTNNSRYHYSFDLGPVRHLTLREASDKALYQTWLRTDYMTAVVEVIRRILIEELVADDDDDDDEEEEEEEDNHSSNNNNSSISCNISNTSLAQHRRVMMKYALSAYHWKSSAKLLIDAMHADTPIITA